MPLPRISLGEAFAVAIVFCGLLAAIRFAGEILTTLLGLLVGLLFLYALLAAIFDRGPARAAAAGFAIAAGLYGALFVASGVRQETDSLGFRLMPYDAPVQHDELNFRTASLPTTEVLEPLHNVLAVEQWVQTDTDEAMTITRDAAGTMYDPRGRVFDPASPAVPRTWRSRVQNPEEGQFLAVAHFAWALMFGYVGSFFARVAYARGRRYASESASERRVSALRDFDATDDVETNTGGSRPPLA